MHPTFAYLSKPGESSLLQEYSSESLEQMVIVRTEHSTNKNKSVSNYAVFSIGEMLEGAYKAKADESKFSFHEIIRNVQQKLRFDIEGKREELVNSTRGIESACPEDSEEKFVEIFSRIVVRVFNDTYSIQEISPEDVLVFTSSGFSVSHNYDKSSFHVVIAPTKYCVLNALATKQFAKRVVDNLPEPMRKFIDLEIYSNNHSLRIYGSAKEGRVKKLFGKPRNSEEEIMVASLVSFPFKRHGNIFIRLEPLSLFIGVTENTPGSNLSRELINEFAPMIFEELTKIYDGKFRIEASANNLANGVIRLRRLKPCFCEICQTVHDSEHKYITISSQRNEITCREFCFRDQEKRSIVVFRRNLSLLDEMPVPKATVKPLNLVLSSMNKDAEAYTSINFTENNHPDKTIEYEEQHTKEFPSPQDLANAEGKTSLCVRAGMGTGKTVQLINYMKTFYRDSGASVPKIVFVSFRVTFAYELLTKLRKAGLDFALYKDIQTPCISLTKYPKLIIQTESLHRLNVEELRLDPPDLLVLDESESIMRQVVSGLGRFALTSVLSLCNLIEQSQCVVAMDALMTNRTYNVITTLRDPKRLTLIRNNFKMYKNRTFIISPNMQFFLKSIEEAIAHNKKIVVPSNNRQIAKMIAKLYRNKRKVQLYSSETDEKTKAEHFKDIYQYMTADLLIYTPSLSAGVSYERQYYDEMFCFFTNASTTVEECMQMLGRVREIKTNKITVFIDYINKQKATNINDIINHFRLRWTQLCDEEPKVAKQGLKSLEIATKMTNSLDYVYPLKFADERTETKINNARFVIITENKRMVNESKRRFCQRLFQRIVYDCGSKIEIASGKQLSRHWFIATPADGETSAKAILEEIREEELDEIRTAKRLTLDEFRAICVKPYPSMAEKASAQKFQIVHDFNLDITAFEHPNSDIAYYLRKRSRRCLENVRAITSMIKSKLDQTTHDNENSESDNDLRVFTPLENVKVGNGIGEIIFERKQHIQDVSKYLYSRNGEAVGDLCGIVYTVQENRDVIRHELAHNVVRCLGFFHVFDTQFKSESLVKATLRIAEPKLRKLLERCEILFPKLAKFLQNESQTLVRRASKLLSYVYSAKIVKIKNSYRIEHKILANTFSNKKNFIRIKK